MATFEREVRQILEAHGCRFDRQGKGDHEIWYSPITERKFTVDGKIKSRHTANAIMKQAGIAHKF
jgi:predicted RNA binding protein YcfA (HicA-like mRNA interferase family)